jgi:uncharacterized protein
MLYQDGNRSRQRPSYPPAMRPRTRPSRALAALIGAAGMLLGGCREFANHRTTLGSLHGVGNYPAAAATLDDPKVKAEYGAKNELLWNLDRGAIALACDEDDKAIELLEDAERAIEVQREKSAADVIGQWTINDTASKYIPEPYEDMYVNVLKLLAQLEAGRLEGGATVEARRAASKADLLRDQYVKYSEQMKKKGGQKLASAGTPKLTTGGQFVESPLATYLTALTFLKTGEDQHAAVAFRRLLDSLEVQDGLVGPVNAEDFKDLEQIAPDDFNALVVAFSGRGPTKYAERIGPIPLGTVPIYMELPRLQSHPSVVGSARVEVETFSGPSTIAKTKFVEDLSRVAIANHEQMMPLIYARTFMRYALKAGASVALTEMARRNSRDNSQGAVQVLGVLAGLAVLAATEEADLRSWVFLPGQARVATFKLPPGKHKVRVVYESHLGGAAYTSAWQEVDASPGGLATVVTHYAR